MCLRNEGPRPSLPPQPPVVSDLCATEQEFPVPHAGETWFCVLYLSGSPRLPGRWPMGRPSWKNGKYGDPARHVSAGRFSGSDHSSALERGGMHKHRPSSTCPAGPHAASDLQGIQAPQPPEGSRLDLSDSVKAKIPVKRQKMRLQRDIFTRHSSGPLVNIHLQRVRRRLRNEITQLIPWMNHLWRMLPSTGTFI